MKAKINLPALPQAASYARLRAQLTQTGWISQGYVQDRGPGAGGPCYQWTRKVKGKTVSVALSQEQYQWLKEAIANWRRVQKILQEMQRLSRQVLFETVPNPKRHKQLGKKVLDLFKRHSPLACKVVNAHTHRFKPAPRAAKQPRRHQSDCRRKKRLWPAVAGRVAVKTAPVLSAALVTGSQTVAGVKLVDVISFIPAPLSGHFSVRPVPAKVASNLSGAVSWPSAPATGRVLPPSSKNERVSNPARPVPGRRWY